MVKREPERDYCGVIVSYRYMGYDFLTLQEAEQLRAFHYKNRTHNEYFPILKWVWPIGSPRFVNVKDSLETNKLVFYKDEDVSHRVPDRTIDF